VALEPSAITPAQWTSFIDQFAESTKAGMIAAATNHGIQIQFFVDETGRSYVDCEFDFLVQLNAFDVVSTELTPLSESSETRTENELITTTVTTTLEERTVQNSEVTGADVVTEQTTIRGAQTVSGTQTETGSQTANHPNSQSTVTSTGSDSTTETMTYTEIA
jgi:hypothetical protein